LTYGHKVETLLNPSCTSPPIIPMAEGPVPL
jgi:hypothetical protein